MFVSFFFAAGLAVTLAVTAFHESMNFVLKPQKRECFYEHFIADSPVYKVEAFVLSGGNLDVLLTIHGPLSKDEEMEETFEDRIFMDNVDSYKETDSETLTYTTRFKAKKEGTYAFCLDNRKSHFASRTVQLDVRPIESLENKIGAIVESDLKNAEVDETKLKESLSSLNAIHSGLTRIQLQQQRDRHRLSLHSETNHSNYTSVFAGSILETAVFIAAAIFQIYFVRRWFAAKTPGRAKAWA